MLNRIFILMLSFSFAFFEASAQDQEDIILKGSQLFGGLKARQIGPAIMSGRISDLESHPTNPRVLYAGTAGGGVWKSSNGGASFTSIFDDYCQSIGVVTLDPNDPDNTIWVGTGEIWTRNSVSVGDGLYRSTDGGLNWKKIGFENSDRISSIEINPKNSDEIYVGVLGALWGDSEERGVYKSTDGGETWNQVLYVDKKTGCSDLVMDPENPNILYAGFWEFRRTAWSFSSGGKQSALYKSTDGGANWNKIHNGFPSGDLGRIALAIAPSQSSTLYAVLETEKDRDNGLYRSDDAGASWKLLNGDFGLVVRPFYFSRIVVDPKDPEVVAKGGLFGSISRDGGNTFKNMGQMHPDIHDVSFHINDSDRVFVATDGGLYRSSDGTNTMEIVANIPVSQFYHVSVDNQEPYNVYGGLQDNGSWYGPSSSPGGIEARDWNNVGFGDGFRVLKHPTKDLLYSEMQGAENIWRVDMNTLKTKSIQPLPIKDDPKLRFNWNAPIVQSPSNPDRIYVGSQFLHVSDDMGDNWKKISPDLTTNDPKKQNQEDSGGLSKDNSGAENHCTIFTIAESPKDKNVIWVGTDDGQVQVSKNAGKNWSNTTDKLDGLPPNTWCYHIEASTHDAGTAYAVFDGHTSNDKNAYVYKTSDYGATWKNIGTDDIYGFARSFQEDYVNPDLLFVGTEFGLYATINGGKNWNKFTNNMPATAIHYLDMQERTSDLVMGTHGRGIIILDDVSPLRNLTQEVLVKDVHFFKSKPAVIKEKGSFGRTATEMEFVGPNPNEDVKIIYYLKKKHIFGKMTMEVQDLDGNKIATLSPGKSKGINIVDWDYSTRAPKLAKASSFAFGGFNAPRAQAGDYKIVMTKGKETFETMITLLNDPDSPYSDADRDLLHTTVMKLHGMSEDLAYKVYELDEYIALSEKLEGNEVAESANKEMNALKETLVVTGSDNYVGAKESQLRGKLADLYGKLAGGFEPPSVTELDNLKLLEERFNNSMKDFEDVKSNVFSKLIAELESADIEIPTLETFEEFIK